MAALALRPLAPVLRQGAAAGRRTVSRACDGPQPHAAPACHPAPQPACRPRPAAAVQRGMRVVCCAPPPGARPPCAPPAAAPPLSCEDRTYSGHISRCVPEAASEQMSAGRCGRGQDRVARRLAAASAARRDHYEREAAQRKPAPPAPLAPYTLGEDRVCSRATDGREYTLPCAPAPLPRCGPARAPPEPRCVSLRPDNDTCRVSDGRLDPCAHRPRVFVEIDRGTPPPAAPPATALPMDPPTQRSLTSRIMDGLGRSRRPPGPCGCAGETSRRRLHTSAATLTEKAPRDECRAGAGSTGRETATDGLATMLRERASLAAAGRGRVAVRCSASADPTRLPPPASLLELPVPRGEERVTVCVSLAGPASPAEPLAPTSGGRAGCGPPCGPGGSWLSLKTIQKRFAACHRGAGGACPPAPNVASSPNPCSMLPKTCANKKPPRVSPCADKKMNSPPNTNKNFTPLKFLNELILVIT